MKMLQRLDYAAKLFSGVFTWNDLVNLPLYYYEYILAARNEQLKEAQELYEKTGQASIYMQSNDATNAMAALGATLASVSGPRKDGEPEPPPKERRRHEYTQRDFAADYLRERKLLKD